MHLAIQLHEALLVTVGHQRLLQGQVAAQVAQLIVGDPGCHQLGRSGFDGFADEGAFADVGHRQPGDEGPGLRHHIDQTIGGEPGHGIGHRAARHAQTITDLGLADDVAGAEGQRQDRALKALIDLLAQ